MFLWLLLVLSFALYFLSNVALALGASACIRLIRRSGREMPPGLLFAWRLAPAVGALACVGVLFLPSFLALEPREGVETPGRPLLLLALAAAALIAAAFARGSISLLKTRGLVRSWLRESAPRTLDSGIVVHEVRSAFPIVAAVGVLRPRFVAASQVLEALGPAELEVALAHERAHVRAFDNLKRLALSVIPDVFGGLPDGAWVQASWEQAAERAADQDAVCGSRERALDLCGALLKVARLVPEGASMPAPFAALHGGGDLADRVSRLLGESSPQVSEGGSGLVFFAGAFLALSLFLARLGVVHELTEILVQALR